MEEKLKKMWAYLRLMRYQVKCIEVLMHISETREDFTYSVKTFVEGARDPLHIFAQGHRTLDEVMQGYLEYLQTLAIEHVKTKKDEADILEAELRNLAR